MSKEWLWTGYRAGVLCNEGLQLKVAEGGGGWEVPGCKEPPVTFNDSAWQLGWRHGAGGRRRQMTRSETVTRSLPTQRLMEAGCCWATAEDQPATSPGNCPGVSGSFSRVEGMWWWRCLRREALGQGADISLVSPEEVGLSIGHPEESSIDFVSRQSSAQLLDVLGVARFQRSFVKHPVLVSWRGERRAGPGFHLGSWVSGGVQ